MDINFTLYDTIRSMVIGSVADKEGSSVFKMEDGSIPP